MFLELIIVLLNINKLFIIKNFFKLKKNQTKINQ